LRHKKITERDNGEFILWGNRNKYHIVNKR